MGHLLRALLAVALAAAPAAGEHPEHGDHEHAALEWTVHTPMPSLHSDAPAVATPAGMVLIAGGCGGTQLSCDDPEMWADCTYCSHVTAEVLECVARCRCCCCHSYDTTPTHQRPPALGTTLRPIRGRRCPTRRTRATATRPPSRRTAS